MKLKGHKNLIAGGATLTVSLTLATLSDCWLPGFLAPFGLVNPDTLATSNTLRGMSRETLKRQVQPGSPIERPFGDYLFRRQ